MAFTQTAHLCHALSELRERTFTPPALQYRRIYGGLTTVRDTAAGVREHLTASREHQRGLLKDFVTRREAPEMCTPSNTRRSVGLTGEHLRAKIARARPPAQEAGWNRRRTRTLPRASEHQMRG